MAEVLGEVGTVVYNPASPLPPFAKTFSNLCVSGAGSDTTAISLRAMLYYMLKNPSTMRKLQHEIAEMEAKGQISDPVTYAQSCKMPYLQAVMKEAMRYAPPLLVQLPCEFIPLV